MGGGGVEGGAIIGVDLVRCGCWLTDRGGQAWLCGYAGNNNGGSLRVFVPP